MSAVPTISTDIRDLEREIATSWSRVAIELYALQVPSNWPTPVYDVTEAAAGYDDEEMLEQNKQEVERAVRYLDARGLLQRPFAGQPNLVTFAPERNAQ